MHSEAGMLTRRALLLLETSMHKCCAVTNGDSRCRAWCGIVAISAWCAMNLVRFIRSQGALHTYMQ